MNKPCVQHKLAFKDWDTPELRGMMQHGVKFRKCLKCRWIIKKPIVKDKFWEDVRSDSDDVMSGLAESNNMSVDEYKEIMGID